MAESKVVGGGEKWVAVVLAPLAVTDGRGKRWQAAEARIAAAGGVGTEEDLRIVAQEQAYWDATNPEGGG